MANQTTTTSPEVKETAGQFALNFRDIALGAITAIASAVFTVIIDAIQTGGLRNIDWELVAQVSISALLGYLSKNFFTPKKTIVLAPSNEVRIVEKETGATLRTASDEEAMLKTRHEKPNL